MLRIVLVAVALAAAFASGLYTGHARSWPFGTIWHAKRWLAGERGVYLDPAVIAAADVDRALTGPMDLVMLGDSLTERGRWNELFPGVRVANRGIGGDTVAGVERRLATVLAVRPRRVVLTIGGNDINAGNDMVQARAALDRVLAALAARARVVLVTVPPCLCGDGRNARIAAWNRDLAALARQHRLPLVDLHAALLQGGKPDPAMFVDGAHLGGGAYRRWQALLLPEVQR